MFDFEFSSQRITKELLLKHNNEETYLSHYLGVPISNKLILSPLRSDSKPTCAFFRGKTGNLYFKDFATGECLTFEGVVMKIYNCNYGEALQIIAEDFGIVKRHSHKTKNIIPVKKIVKQPKFEAPKETVIQVEIKNFAEHELKWWNSFGISQQLLNKYKVFSCNTVFLNGNIFAKSSQSFPIYGYYFGKKEGIEQWRIYMPKSKQCRFIGNVSTKTIQGFHQLPKTGKLLVITKSMKDTLVFASFGLPSCSPNSETQFCDDKILENLRNRFKYIAILYDNDATGISFTNKIRKQYPWIIPTLIPRKSGTKDISDYLKKYGKEATKQLIQNAINNYIQNEKIGIEH